MQYFREIDIKLSDSTETSMPDNGPKMKLYCSMWLMTSYIESNMAIVI
jgi:hypothetical protein